MSTAQIRNYSKPLIGTISLPGDKSISHRRALFSALTSDCCVLENFGSGDDCRSSLECIRQLGKIVFESGADITISGNVSATEATLDCGNSGTTARLLMGMLAGKRGHWTLVGDESLSSRPMERVAAPLRLMGAKISLCNGHLPAVITGSELHAIEYNSPVISAQVKSAVLLAGLQASGATRYRERAGTRDHTERLLKLKPDNAGWISVDSSMTVTGEQLSGTIPGDPSSAMFWIVAALAIPGSELHLNNVLLNPERIAVLSLLRSLGADIESHLLRDSCGEPCGNIRVAASDVEPIRVSAEIVPSIIDEIPALAVLASQINGVSVFDGVDELRLKESDRIRLIVDNLRAMGVNVSERASGFSVHGGASLRSANIQTAGDHRIAMAFGVAGLLAEGVCRIEQSECVAVSYPNFWQELDTLAPGSVTLSDE